MDSVEIKGYKYIGAGFLINLCYFQNTSPSRILSLVLYWAVNDILDGVNLIHLGINLNWIPTYNT